MAFWKRSENDFDPYSEEKAGETGEIQLRCKKSPKACQVIFQVDLGYSRSIAQ
jgi:hypothetical protein